MYAYLTNCDYPEGLKIVHITYMLTLIVLFSNFYMKSYSKKKSSDGDKKHQ